MSKSSSGCNPMGQRPEESPVNRSAWDCNHFQAFRSACSRNASSKLIPARHELFPPISVASSPCPAMNLSLTFHPFCLHVPLQLGQEMFILVWCSFLLCMGKEECLLQQRGICISAAMTNPGCISPICWKKDSAQEITVQITNGCGLSMVFLNREENTALS